MLSQESKGLKQTPHALLYFFFQQELKAKLEHLQNEKKTKTIDASGQMKKLYTENKVSF